MNYMNVKLFRLKMMAPLRYAILLIATLRSATLRFAYIQDVSQCTHPNVHILNTWLGYHPCQDRDGPTFPLVIFFQLTSRSFFKLNFLTLEIRSSVPMCTS